ncbi:centromere protein H [Morus bassanus]
MEELPPAAAGAETRAQVGAGTGFRAQAEAGPGARAGARAAAEDVAGAEVDILMLLRLRNQMKQQLMELSTALHTDQDDVRGQTDGERCIMNAIQDFEKDMEQLKISFQNKTLALQRLQLTVALRNKVKQNDNDSRLILETLKHIVMLSNEVVKCQQEAREKEQELFDIRRKRFLLKKAGEQKLLQIRNVMKKQKEEKASMEVKEVLAELCNNLEKERNLTTVIQNVFQNIIIGSRVNWAEDPSLRAIVLQLEKNVCSL